VAAAGYVVLAGSGLVGPDLGLAGPNQLTSFAWAGEVGLERGGGVAAGRGFLRSCLINCVDPVASIVRNGDFLSLAAQVSDAV
jgi:hypothetical protein